MDKGKGSAPAAEVFCGGAKLIQSEAALVTGYGAAVQRGVISALHREVGWIGDNKVKKSCLIYLTEIADVSFNNSLRLKAVGLKIAAAEQGGVVLNVYARHFCVRTAVA